MGRQTREVDVCDECGTHEEVSEWPQLGCGDFCDTCAFDLFDNHQCKVCGDFDVNTGPLVKHEDKNTCPFCLEDLTAEREDDE